MNILIWFPLPILLARSGDKPAARQLLDEVVRTDPYHTPFWFWLAEAQETLPSWVGVTFYVTRPVMNGRAAVGTDHRYGKEYR